MSLSGRSAVELQSNGSRTAVESKSKAVGARKTKMMPPPEFPKRVTIYPFVLTQYWHGTNGQTYIIGKTTSRSTYIVGMLKRDKNRRKLIDS